MWLYRQSRFVYALQRFLNRAASVMTWGGICLLFGVTTGAGAVVLSALILVAIVGVVGVILGPNFLSAMLLMGSPTIFGLPNEVLRPLPFVTVERILVAVILVLVFLRMAFVKEKQPRVLPMEIMMVIFMGYAFISLLLHTTPDTMSQDGWFLFQYALPMLSFMASRRLIWTEQGVNRLIISLSFVGVFLGFSGILQSLFGVDIFTMDYQTITKGHTDRAYGTFSNAHTYIATLFIFLMLTLFQYNMYKDKLIKFIIICFIGVMGIGILLGETRAPWGGVGVGLGIVFLRDKNVRPLMVTGAYIAGIMGLIIVTFFWNELTDFMNRVSDTGTMEGRLTMWGVAFNMIVNNPVFGIGFGFDSFQTHMAEYARGIISLPYHRTSYLAVPHDEYIHVTLLLGFPGLFLFLGILSGMLKTLYKKHMDPANSQTNRKLSLYVGAILCGIMFNSLFSDTHVQDYFWLATYFFAGLVAGLPPDFGRGHNRFEAEEFADVSPSRET